MTICVQSDFDYRVDSKSELAESGEEKRRCPAGGRQISEEEEEELPFPFS